MQRTVTNGRNFECYSEDPELAADLAVAYITGLQGNGVAATVKHFIGNESEIERTTINSAIDERTLREVYLRPFEAAVKQADVWGIMSSYNKLNGIYTAENEWLLSKVLRDEWGFDGIVMSDWFGSRTTAPTVNAGLDLEMPGPTRDRGATLVQAVHDGLVRAQTVRERALAMLRLMERVGSLSDHRPFEEHADNRPEHRALIRQAGSAGTVLLKNDDVLPLNPNTGTIAVIGPNADVAQIMGGGSAQLNPHYRVTPLDGMIERIGQDCIAFAKGCANHRWEPVIDGEFHAEYFDNEDLRGSAVHSEIIDGSVVFWHEEVAEGKVDSNAFSARVSGTFTAKEDGEHSFGLHAAAYAKLYVDGALVVDAWDTWCKGRTFFEEGCDERTGTVNLAAGQTVSVVMELRTKAADNLYFTAFRFGVSRVLGAREIDAAVAAASRCDTAVVFVGRSGEWDTEGSDLENIELPRNQNALITAVCAANPNTIVVLQTGGPVEMPWVAQAPAILQAWYPGQECGNAIADVLFGHADPAGRLPQTFPVRWSDNPSYSQDPEIYPGSAGTVRYGEGVFVGYRHYEKYGIKPLFPFGHGLSYTEFALSDVTVHTNDEGIEISVNVTNVGDRSGSTVVQLYISDQNSTLERPAQELRVFKKVSLQVGQKTIVNLVLSPRDFAYFDVSDDCWRVNGGTYTVHIGFSSSDIVMTQDVTQTACVLPV
jgi:beta-glucosidase